jgi:stage II sporulation protein R
MTRFTDEVKCLIALAMVIVMGFVLVITYTVPSSDTANEHEGIIRLHVIANSDSDDDQALKLQVRDEIIKYMTSQNEASSIDDISASRQFIKKNLTTFEAIARDQITAEGYDYTATAALEVCYIPEKNYGDITFPAGNYEALNITIGSGEGQNWWCVLFPPLCIIDEGTEELTADGLDEEERLQLKLKLLEILD